MKNSILVTISVAIILFGIRTALIMVFWNWTMPMLFNLPHVTWGHATQLYLLVYALCVHAIPSKG